MRNVLTAVFSGSRASRTSPLYQYDYGQKMDFRGISGLPATYEVHFSNQEHGASKTAIGDETGVIIPDEYLTSGETIYAWIYLHTGQDDGETEYRITIPVTKRAKPSDAEPTPVQQDAITQAIALLQDESGRAEQSADRAEGAAERAEEAAASINEEMIEEAVSDYLDEHPITVTELDPTVPSWAKQANKPTYTAQEVGALPSSTVIPSKVSDLTNDAGYITSAPVQSVNNKTGAVVLNASDVGAYALPSGGIPKNNLATDVQASLSKADSALQSAPVTSVDGKTGAVTILPTGGSTGQVLKKTSGSNYAVEWANESGSGGGTSDYTDLTNKPQINSVTLSGNKSSSDLGLLEASDITASKVGDTTTIYVNGVAIATVKDGTDGQDGEDGYSPSASVSKSGDTATISITDKDGTTTATVTDGQDGRDGHDGQDGYSPTASVSKAGTTATITITDKNGTTTAQVSDGQDGQDGDDGYSPTATVSKSGTTATISITDKNGTTTAQVSDGTDGQDGDDGTTPTTTVTTITGGHNVAFSYGTGDSRNTDFDVMDGQDGHTPVKGVDYWTAQDQAAIVDDVVDEVGVKTVTVSGTTPTITGVANTRYMCGEVSTISITPSQSGIIDVIFTSGSSVAVLIVPSTVKWPSGFDPTSLEANTTYELNILDGVYGAVMTWA